MPTEHAPINVLLRSEQSGGQIAVMDNIVGAGFPGPPLHHRDFDEMFYVMEGELTFYLEDGEPIPASAGSFVHIPKGVAHAFRVDSRTARILNLSTPQHEHFYRAAGEPARGRFLPPEGPPDMDKVGSAARQYGVEILGPPPGANV